MKIFVMERGFVICGEPTVTGHSDKDFYVLRRCGVIRKWGTTLGLGQLAVEGPQSGTIIDKEPDGTKISRRAIYREIPCEAEAWKKWK